MKPRLLRYIVNGTCFGAAGVLLIAGCGEQPTAGSLERTPAAPSFSIVGGTSCDTARAWDLDGPHVASPSVSVSANVCGGVASGTIRTITMEWTTLGLHSDSKYYIWSKRRDRDGTNHDIDSVWAEHIVGIGQYRKVVFQDTLSEAYDAIFVVQLIDDDTERTLTPTNSAFVGGGTGLENARVQIWGEISAPVFDSAKATGPTSAALYWTNGHPGGSQYYTLIRLNGAVLDSTDSPAADSYFVDGLQPGEEYSFTLRHVSLGVLPTAFQGVSQLDQPASDTTTTVAVTTDDLPELGVAIAGPDTTEIMTCTWYATPSGTGGYPVTYEWYDLWQSPGPIGTDSSLAQFTRLWFPHTYNDLRVDVTRVAGSDTSTASDTIHVVVIPMLEPECRGA